MMSRLTVNSSGVLSRRILSLTVVPRLPFILCMTSSDERPRSFSLLMPTILSLGLSPTARAGPPSRTSMITMESSSVGLKKTLTPMPENLPDVESVISS